MTLVPIQFFGIGDIIFEQTLVLALAQGGDVLWPVLPDFVEGLTRAYPAITFISVDALPLNYERREEYTIGNLRVLPLRFADSILDVPYSENMKSKYKLYGMDWHDWKRDAMWQRDYAREQELWDQLGLKDGTPYNFINTNYGSGVPFQIEEPALDNDYAVVRMQIIEGFSLFDWALVIERAATVHTVSTSIIYLLELLDLAAPEVHLYARKPHELDFSAIDYLLQKHRYSKHV